jgi:hypothetical protein
MGQLASVFADDEQVPIHQKPAELGRRFPDKAFDTPVKDGGQPPTSSFQPTFINPLQPHVHDTGTKEDSKAAAPPQMVFNISGPVFIGYPMEQAMQLMQTWQQGRR